MDDMNFNDNIYLTQYIQNRAFQQTTKKPYEKIQCAFCTYYYIQFGPAHVSRVHQVVMPN